MRVKVDKHFASIVHGGKQYNAAGGVVDVPFEVGQVLIEQGHQEITSESAPPEDGAPHKGGRPPKGKT
jgi:hypothetical protein